MKNVLKIALPCLALSIFSAAVPFAPAYAVEAELQIKARIIRCVTHEERWNMCHTENLCCNLLDTEELASALQSSDKPENPNTEYDHDDISATENEDLFATDIRNIETSDNSLAMHVHQDSKEKSIIIE